MVEHPKLFVSYSHDSQEHKAWVLKLATDLRQHMGVDVILDQWNLRIGGDLTFYMEQGLSDAALVLCVCSENYVKKADSGNGGTGYEKMIMTQPLLKNANSDYLIPVIRNNPTSQVPRFLGSKLYVDFTDDGEYINKLSELVARIYGEDVSKKPPLGQNPFSRANADFVDIKNTMEKAKYHSPSMTGTAQFNFSNNSGRFVIGSGEYEFTTSWTQRGSDSIYAYRDGVKQVGYKRMFRDFPSFEEMEEFDFTSRTRTIYLGEVVVWVNNHEKFAATKVLDIKVGNRAVEDSLTFEYKIYC